MFAMYGIGVLAAILVALLLRKTILRGTAPPFIMELPSFKVPSLRVVTIRVLERGWSFIRRAGTLCPSGGFVVVKVAKPQQDMRFDVPTIGMGTLQTLQQAGARVLAIEAEKTIIIDEPEVCAYADRHQISLVAIREGEVTEELGSPSSPAFDAATSA